MLRFVTILGLLSNRSSTKYFRAKKAFRAAEASQRRLEGGVMI